MTGSFNRTLPYTYGCRSLVRISTHTRRENSFWDTPFIPSIFSENNSPTLELSGCGEKVYRRFLWFCLVSPWGWGVFSENRPAPKFELFSDWPCGRSAGQPSLEISSQVWLSFSSQAGPKLTDFNRNVDNRVKPSRAGSHPCIVFIRNNSFYIKI